MSTTNRDDLMNALADLFAKHGTTEVFAALADAADAAGDTVKPADAKLFTMCAAKVREAQGCAERAEASGITIADACEVLADIEA